MKRLNLLSLLIASTLFAGHALAQNVAVVNNKPIPQSKADEVVKMMAARGQPDSKELRAQIRDFLIDRELLLQEAEKRGLGKNPEFQKQLALARENLLMQTLQRDILKTPPSDAEVKAEYERIVKQMGGKEYKARHILVEKEEQAKAIIEQLKKGGKFEELAKQSKDSNAQQGGELDWAAPSNYVQPFSDAMTKLEKGKFTEAPVKTEFGWHVVRLDDVRDSKPPALDDVKGQIIEGMQGQRVEKFRQDLRAKAKIQ